MNWKCWLFGCDFKVIGSRTAMMKWSAGILLNWLGIYDSRTFQIHIERRQCVRCLKSKEYVTYDSSTKEHLNEALDHWVKRNGSEDYP